MMEFPERVTLYDDGVYRWAYYMDMRHNRYMIRLIVKILCLVLGVPALILALFVARRAIPCVQQGLPWPDIQRIMRNDLVSLYVVGGMWLGMVALAELVYFICVLGMNGWWRFCFAMDDSGVALVRNLSTTKAMNTLGTVAAVMGLLAGNPSGVARVGSTLAIAQEAGASTFKLTTRVKVLEQYDLLDIREWFGMNQVFVPKEDFESVKQFILERISDKARYRSER